MPSLEKDFTITFTPDEVSKILIDYVKTGQGLKVDNVDFRLKTVYNDHTDSYGHEILNEIVCQGKLN